MSVKRVCTLNTRVNLSVAEEDERREKKRVKREKKQQNLLIRAIALISYIKRNSDESNS